MSEREYLSPPFLRVLRHAWTDLPPVVLGEAAPWLSRQEARLWGLILSSQGVPHRLNRVGESDGGGYTVQVQEWFVPRAVREISLYFEENRPEDGQVVLPDLRPVSGLEPTVAGLGFLMLFYWAYNMVYPDFGLYPRQWLELGSADGGRILAGEWWRLATALTLHANGPHVAGNCLIGGGFIWLAARRIGSGLAWLLTVGAGVWGNLVNIIVLGVHHDAIGFSTATFGAAGVLAGIAPFGVGGGLHGTGRGPLWQRLLALTQTALIPFGAGLGLLAMLGAGENTDLGAHLFGFLWGLLLGSVTGFVTTRYGLPSRAMDSVLYGTALSIPVFAWTWAWLA